ncbi:RecF/RecN/SMC [Cytidiella melzeri]|nr:RecF/RecN/SMC [Cytidiella melzeri]
MPPRRSGRSRASAEPPTQPTAPQSKRKRPLHDANQPEDVQDDAPTTKTQRSTRVSRKALMNAVESDEEAEEVSPPPVKKSRPSLETESGADESEDDQTTKPARSRRTAVRKPAIGAPAPSRRRKAAAVKQEVDDVAAIEEEEKKEEDEEEEEAVKPSSSRRINTKLEDVSSDEEFEEKKPVRKARSSGASRAAAPRGRRGRTSVPPRASSSRSKRAVSHDGNDSDSLSYADPEPASKAVHHTKKPVIEPIVEQEEEEEEHSLLEPEVPRSPTPKPQVLPMAPVEPQGPKARLVIHKMVLVNFKSYAGRQEIGPFHKSFSSIVGPNGSGKSNTIDALLFVFGYRASKMRQGKLSELIHNSARHPDLEDCSVEVHFREIMDLPGPDAFEVVPDSRLVVARTAYKNNSSKYTINGRQSNYKEVQTLLKGRGIDLDHNRFLILQGEVESIAQMKPKAPNEHEDGLLEYLEDIIGTAQYKEPIDTASQIVEELNEERAEKMNRLKIVERERDALEQEKKEAEDFLRLQNEHVRALSRLWQWYLWKCLENEEAFNSSIADAEKALKEETDRNQDDITHLAMLEKHYKERGDAYEEVQRAAAVALKELTSNEKIQVGLEERRKHAKSKAKKLEKSHKDDVHNRAEAARAIADNTEKLERERRKLEEFEASLSAEEKILEQIRDSLKDKTQVYHDQIEAKQRELQPWTTKINKKQAEVDVAKSEREMLAKKAEAARATLDEAKQTLERLQDDHKAKVAEVDELRSQRTSKVQELRDEQRRLQDIQGRLQELRSKASSSLQKVDEAKASQAANTTQNKVLDTLTRLRSAGRISGFHGRLGSLGTIPDKYDVAVSTACGALNNMVVDTVEQGQACIEYLRKQNVGRASFMVLDKLSPRGMEKVQTPENVPRLFDLIKPKEPRFAPAFYKGVGDTLVAENLDQANRIAFGGQRRWRVVTLAGQLIESSGAMSGGGNYVAKGGMSSKLASDAVSPETLRQYEQDSEAAQRELEQVQGQAHELEATLEGLNRAGPQIDTAIEKANLDVQTGTKRIADAEKRYRELKTKTKPDSGDIARIRALDEEIEAGVAVLEELEGDKAAIDDEIKALEKKILDIGGARLLTQKSKVDGVRLHINLTNDEITKAEVAKAKAEKDVKKLENLIASNSASLDDVKEDLRKLEAELEQCVQYVEVIRSKVADAQSAAENSKDDLDNLKAELDEKTEQIQAFRAKEMELKQQLTDIKKEAFENEKALQHWQKEHDKLKLTDIDDDEDDDDDETAVDAEGSRDAENTMPVDGEDSKQGKNLPEKRRLERKASHALHMYSEAELGTFKKRELVADTELLDEKLKNAKPNLAVLKDYKKREEEFLRRASDLDKVNEKRDIEKQKHDSFCKRRLDEFMTGFSLISLKLKEMYQMITLGGNAELELVDSMDPFSEGIIFSVMPPKKSWKNISNLSGGEKTLSSLALVFALHVYKPTPLYFMDEIDAALDFRNVSIVANYIKDRTKNAQFIIISLRNDMFELSHRLIGIYKTSNATRSKICSRRHV